MDVRLRVKSTLGFIIVNVTMTPANTSACAVNAIQFLEIRVSISFVQCSHNRARAHFPNSNLIIVECKIRTRSSAGRFRTGRLGTLWLRRGAHDRTARSLSHFGTLRSLHFGRRRDRTKRCGWSTLARCCSCGCGVARARCIAREGRHVRVRCLGIGARHLRIRRTGHAQICDHRNIGRFRIFGHAIEVNAFQKFFLNGWTI